MFERIALGWELAKASANVLYQDKKLILFPIISGLLTLVVLVSFWAPLIGLQVAGKIDLLDEQNNAQPPIWFWAFLFAFYFCSYFVIIFCNAALISSALMRFNGESATLGDGFAAAASRLPQIFAWALVSATVGLILRAIENAHEKAGRIISALLGTAWTVLTFFVVPVLVVEKTGPFEAISRSMAILRKTWGEGLVGKFGLGLFKFVLILPAILLLVGGGALLAQGGQLVPLGAVLLGVGILWLLLTSAIGAALDTIFLAALYQYAAFDQVPAGFNRDTLANAFTHKKSA